MSDTPVVEVHKALIVHEGALLLVQRSMGDMHHAGQWDLPGAMVEGGETPEEALRRGIWDETGLHIAAGQAFATTSYDFPPKKPTCIVQATAYLAVCEDAAQAAKLKGQPTSDYVMSAKWVTFRMLPRIKVISGIKPLLDEFISQFVE